jgi:hypothetical protein
MIASPTLCALFRLFAPSARKHTSLGVMIGMGLTASLLCKLPAQDSLPHAETWATNGTVNALAQTSSTIFLGGSFTYVGPVTGAGVPLSRSSGKPVSAYPRIPGEVQVCVPDGSGGWFVGGRFSQVGNQDCSNLAHILPNGSVDASWAASTDGDVYAMVLSGSTLYVGGSYWAANGQGRSRLAAFDATNGQLLDWAPKPNNQVRALALSGTTLYVGGAFSTIGGASRNRIAAVDTVTGLATDWNPDSNNVVYTLAVSGTTVYTGGIFTNIGGEDRSRIAALDATTTGTATAWNPGASNSVSALLVSGSTLYVGAISRNRRKIEAESGRARPGNRVPTDWNPKPDWAVLSLALAGDHTLYVGGCLRI